MRNPGPGAYQPNAKVSELMTAECSDEGADLSNGAENDAEYGNLEGSRTRRLPNQSQSWPSGLFNATQVCEG